MEIRDRLLSFLWVLFANRVTALDGSLEEIERHLEMGKQFLAKGQFADSLTHYHAAVDLDPDNYQTLYRRATVYLAMGKSKSALPDLDKVVVLKPDFIAARIQRANMLLKQGELSLAADDYKTALTIDPGNDGVKEKLALIGPVQEAVDAVDDYLAEGDISSAELYLTKAIDVCPWWAALHEKRAHCYEELGELPKAISDLRALTRLVQDSTDAFYRISLLHYRIGDTQESLNQIRECLKLEPEHKTCFPHYKKVKKLVKQQESLQGFVNEEKWMECLEKAQQVLKSEPRNEAIRLDTDKTLCRCNMKAGHSQEAIQICSAVLEEEPNNHNALCDRADAFIDNEQFDEALADFQAAKKSNDESRRANEGVDRVQRLLKQAAKRDYYKILGVKRSANKRDIMKAYRKLAQKWHPDQFSGDVEKKAAEKKFMDIASAKEVLTDPEKRRRFDHGEDPLDAEEQANANNPFHHGGHPFFGGGGGGPFTFKFHFG